jgi:hypothetical protein
MLKKKTTYFIFFGFLVLFGGCSRMDLALRWADTFVLATVDDYFLMNTSQKTRARSEFNQALEQVRRNEFSRLADLLEDSAQKLESSQFGAPEIEAFHKTFNQIFRAAVGRFELMGQNLLADQVATDFKLFDQEYKEQQEDREKDLGDAKAQSKKTLKSIEDFIEETVEYLNKSQKLELQEFILKHPRPAQLAFQSREKMYEKFKALRKDEALRRAFVTTYFTDWESLQTPEYVKARAENQAQFKLWMAKLLGGLEPGQRKNVVKNFRKRAKDFRDHILK